MNMIERIARSLARRNYPGGSDAENDEMWEAWVDDAATAIQAMREPTPGMVEAGVFRGNMVETWQTMIDAAAIDTGAGEG